MSKFIKVLALSTIIASISIPVFASVQEGRLVVKTKQGHEYQSYAHSTENSTGKSVSGTSTCLQYHDYIREVSSKSGTSAERKHRYNISSYSGTFHPSALVMVQNGARDGAGWAYHSTRK